MPHNLILSTATGKVTVRKLSTGWELNIWVRPEGLSWKSMRRTSTEQHSNYQEAKYQAHIYYRDLLEQTKEWSMKEYLKNEN